MAYAFFWIFVLVAAGLALYALTYRYADRFSRPVLVLCWIVSSAAIGLWLLFDLYYLHLYDNWTWLYEVRSWTGIEWSGALIGVFCALLQRKINEKHKLTDLFSRHNGLVLLIILILPPFLKPILRPADPNFVNEWHQDVALQSEGYTCGPASTATMLRHFDIDRTEQQVAEAIHLNSHGSEAWYIARYLRGQGLEVRFVSTPANPPELPVPSIAGVRLGGPRGVGHFITVLESDGNGRYTIGDPNGGRFLMDEDGLRASYHFVGFFMAVSDRP